MQRDPVAIWRRRRSCEVSPDNPTDCNVHPLHQGGVGRARASRARQKFEAKTKAFDETANKWVTSKSVEVIYIPPSRKIFATYDNRRNRAIFLFASLGELDIRTRLYRFFITVWKNKLFRLKSRSSSPSGIRCTIWSHTSKGRSGTIAGIECCTGGSVALTHFIVVMDLC